jgi:hypothetical protein
VSAVSFLSLSLSLFLSATRRGPVRGARFTTCSVTKSRSLPS